MMYGHEKSDHAIVAGKPTNKAERSAGELLSEGQGPSEVAGLFGSFQTIRLIHFLCMSAIVAFVAVHCVGAFLHTR
jgi:hypothetical protein